MEDDQDDDHPCPQAVVLSQTCWEYRNLLGQERASQEKHDAAVTGIPAGTPAATTSAVTTAWASISSKTSPRNARGRSEDGQPAPKRAKTAATATPRADSPRRASETTPLQTLRLAGKGEVPKRRRSWDIFVLVLQASGLQQITSKAGSEIDFGTLLVADQSVSFFRLTLWARAARAGGRLIRPGDLVRFNGVAVSSFRGAVQASTTRSTSFRVVWRGDAFTTPHDAPNTTMLSQGWSSSKGRGGHRRFQPAAGPVLSQDDELAVSREDACALAAWAKREYPSVTSTERHGQQAGTTGRSAGRPGSSSLGSVRKGVETTVRACVLEASEVERLWMWESVGGKRRKDLVSRATALLTDGQHEMTLQLWGDMASGDTVQSLREGAIAALRSSARGGAVQKPPVFEFSRLQPSFSFSCEALVLNGKSGTVKRMESDSAGAVSVSAAVLTAAAAAAAAAAATVAAADPPTAAVGAAAGSAEHDEETIRRVDTAKSLRAGEEAARFLAEEGGPAAARRFESVAALMSADGFSGAGYLSNVVVRKVDAPSLSRPGIVLHPCCDGGGHPLNSRLPPPSRAGVDPPLTIYLGDPDEAEPAKEVAQSAAGVEAVLRVTVGGGARCDLLGGIPGELLLPPTGGHARVDAVADAGRTVAKSLLDGLEVEGERVDVVLACSAALDANERVIPGGARYRLVSLEPSYLSGEIDSSKRRKKG